MIITKPIECTGGVPYYDKSYYSDVRMTEVYKDGNTSYVVLAGNADTIEEFLQEYFVSIYDDPKLGYDFEDILMQATEIK